VAFYENLNAGEKPQAVGVFGAVLCARRHGETGGGGWEWCPIPSESSRTGQGTWLVPPPVYPQQRPHYFKHNTTKNALINSEGTIRSPTFAAQRGAMHYTRFLFHEAANGTPSKK